jgi:hypothetical protein
MAMAKSVKERFMETVKQANTLSDGVQVAEDSQSASANQAVGVKQVSVELPIMAERDQSSNCGPIHLDGVDLTRDQSNKLRRIAAGLDKTGAVCETRSGRRRATHWRHAIRYILDQVEA